MPRLGTPGRAAPAAAGFDTIVRRMGEPRSLGPLWFVALTLVALVVAPITAEWYTRPLFDELRTVAAPAQQLLTRVHVALALEGSTLRDFAETGNPVFAARFRQTRRRELEAQRQLALLSTRLGPAVEQRYAALSEAERRWHAAAEQLLVSEGARRAADDERRQQLYEGVLTAAAQLDEALDDAGQARRLGIRDAGRLQRRVSVVLSGLALLALGAVAWLAGRLRASAAAAADGRRAVESLMESKARLMRGVSHDLKNPLNAIDGYAALLADGVGGDLSTEQRRSIERIRASAGTVLALVDDLLELSRAEVGQLQVACRPTDVRDVVLDVVEEHRAGAQAAAHLLEVQAPEDVPPVETDPARVRQVLGNLLSNAIKYTPAGGRITVEIQTAGSGGRWATETWLAVHVDDTGPGIPASQLEVVFDEFTRLDRTGQRGSGLGLAIARRIARLLGGALTVESELGRGSRFTLWLPMNCPSVDREMTTASASFAA